MPEMTPLNYSHLQELGFTLLIPIVGQNKPEQDEAVTMWGKEMDNRVIRLEFHQKINGTAGDESKQEKQSAPFHPGGLKLYAGEKTSPELQYEATIFYAEELDAFMKPSE